MTRPTHPGMRCQKCGAQMNPHAQKLIVTSNTAEPGFDPQLGGYLEEANACPSCGNVEVRRV